jgi:hypothetical protein
MVNKSIKADFFNRWYEKHFSYSKTNDQTFRDSQQDSKLHVVNVSNGQVVKGLFTVKSRAIFKVT